MKIGILTQPLQNNYGGLLQNYALQQVLLQYGHTPETIDHGSRKIHWFRLLLIECKCIVKRLLSLYAKGGKKYYRPTKEELGAIGRNTNYFVEKYIYRTKKFYSDAGLHRIIEQGKYEAYVVGSDQCWRPIYSGGFLLESFLNFVENKSNIKRIAYAASFGTDEWEFNAKDTKECARLAKLFDCITVREDSGIRLCKENLGVDAEHVLDPTMLLSKEDYISLVEKEHEPQSDGDLFYYILDPTEQKSIFINKVCDVLNMKSFTVFPRLQLRNSTKNEVKNNIEAYVYPSVTKWLRAFVDAKMVVVDSFHGAVFSIIFNKPFWVIPNKERGNARFSSLLKMFDLENRLINDTSIEGVDFAIPIDWNRVNDIRREKIEHSKNVFSFLK